MPMLSKLAAQYRDKDVSFLAVSLDDAQSQPKIPRFLEKKKNHASIFTGARPQRFTISNSAKSFPATIILDRDGSAIFRIMGEASKKDISARVDWLLSTRTSKSPKPLLKILDRALELASNHRHSEPCPPRARRGGQTGGARL